MEHIFEELDYRETPLGAISLRRRTDPRLDNKLIYEVKLNDEWLMSSLFVEAEEQLAGLGLEQVKRNGFTSQLHIIVGGLGLGYTSRTALDDKAVSSLKTIEVMPAVIEWHEQGILPIGDVLSSDARSSLIQHDFFAFAAQPINKAIQSEPVHAILLDIDHSPSHWLNQENQDFYSIDSLQSLQNKIVPNGVFGLWSNELPDQSFVDLLSSVFKNTATHVVEFANPYSGESSSNSVYICTV